MLRLSPRQMTRYIKTLTALGVISVRQGPKAGKAAGHDGTITFANGKRQETGFGPQFILGIPFKRASHENTAQSPPSILHRPVARSLVPRLPDEKRAEIVAALGESGCRTFQAWVHKSWDRRSPHPPRPFDFWNARLADWREHISTAEASARAEREIAATAQRARELRKGIADTAGDRAVIAADLRKRLAQFPSQVSARG